MDFPPVHRVVTGHDADGGAIIASDGPLAVARELAHVPGVMFHEIWSTQATPAPIDNGADPVTGDIVLPPPANGSRIRFVDFPPETDELLATDAQAAFSEIGDAGAATGTADAPHPFMHRTETVDYGIVLDGEMTLVLDKGEVALKPGSVVVQRGTNHAWANRSGKPCRMAFILIDGAYGDGFAPTPPPG